MEQYTVKIRVEVPSSLCVPDLDQYCLHNFSQLSQNLCMQGVDFLPLKFDFSWFLVIMQCSFQLLILERICHFQFSLKEKKYLQDILIFDPRSYSDEINEF